MSWCQRIAESIRETFTTRKGFINNLRTLWIAVFAFVLVGFFAFIALNFTILNPIAQAIQEFSLTDIYYQILAQTPDTSRAITVVDMSKIYTRGEVASLLYEIEAQEPSVVGVDITFKDERTDYQGNDMLVDIAKTYDNIVFAYYRQNVVNNKEEDVHSFFTDSIPVTEGFTDMPRGLYGVMKRQVPLAGFSKDTVCYSFASAVANKYEGKKLVPPEPRDMTINYEPTEFTVLPYDSVMQHPELISGRIVLVGGINRLEDMHDTPLGKMPGTVLLAYSIQTILENKEVKSIPTIGLALISLLLVMFTCKGQQFYSFIIAENVKHKMTRNLLESDYLQGLLTSLWTALLLGFAFLVFCKYHTNINLGWAFAGISTLSSSTSLYNTISDNLCPEKPEEPDNTQQIQQQ